MLNINKVETFYGNIQALRGVDVKVNDGEIVALIGSNGAGKSTLLMTISGVNKAATGDILFDSKSIANLPPHDIVNLGISQVPDGRRIFSIQFEQVLDQNICSAKFMPLVGFSDKEMKRYEDNPMIAKSNDHDKKIFLKDNQIKGLIYILFFFWVLAFLLPCLEVFYWCCAGYVSV